MKPGVCKHRTLHNKLASPWCLKCGKQCKDITADKCPESTETNTNECPKNTEMEVWDE